MELNRFQVLTRSRVGTRGNPFLLLGNTIPSGGEKGAVGGQVHTGLPPGSCRSQATRRDTSSLRGSACTVIGSRLPLIWVEGRRLKPDAAGSDLEYREPEAAQGDREQENQPDALPSVEAAHWGRFARHMGGNDLTLPRFRPRGGSRSATRVRTVPGRGADIRRPDSMSAVHPWASSVSAGQGVSHLLRPLS